MNRDAADLVENISLAVTTQVYDPLLEKINKLSEKLEGISKKVFGEQDLRDLKTREKKDLLSALNEVKDQIGNETLTLDGNQVLNEDQKKIVRDKINIYSKSEIDSQLNDKGIDKKRIEDIFKGTINKSNQSSQSSLTEGLSQVDQNQGIKTNAPLKNNLEGVLPGNQNSGSHKNNIQIKDWKISAGDTHSLAVSDKGDLYSWGDNGNSQLGRRTKNKSSTTPGKVGFPEEVKIVQAAAGKFHSLALDSNGTLYSWGNNGNSQLGRRTKNKSSTTPGKVGFPEEVKIVQAAAGKFHSLALDSNGKLYSWGSDENEQLGRKISDSNPPSNPLEVEFPEGIKIIQATARGLHSLALDNNGRLYRWGSDILSQIDFIIKPLEVKFPEGIKIIQAAAGRLHSLALDNNGRLYRWGNDIVNNQYIFVIKPLEVEFPEGVKIIQAAAGSVHSLALDSNGKLYSWGYNVSGQLGGTVQQNKVSSIPGKVKFSQEVRIIQVAAGKSHNLVLDINGKLYSWGENSDGQLGDETTIERNTPVEVKLPADFFSKQGPVSDS